MNRNAITLTSSLRIPKEKLKKFYGSRFVTEESFIIGYSQNVMVGRPGFEPGTYAVSELDSHKLLS